LSTRSRTSLKPDDLASALSEPTIAEVRQHPRFRAACETDAALAIAYFRQIEESCQWVMKDIGRSSICLTALILHAIQALTAQTLTSSCLDNNLSSAGRVTQLVKRCLDQGTMTLEAGDDRWTRRTLTLGPRLLQVLRRRAQIEVAAAAALAPEIEAVHAIMENEADFLAFIRNLAVAMSSSAHRGAFNAVTPTRLFLEREAGMLILFDLMLSQAPDRKRLLESAPLSRLALSRRYDVSRAHINKVLAEAENRGLLHCPTTDRIVFSAELSDALERQFAFVFQGALLASRATLAQLERAA